jgi:hypothetical protein
MAQITGVAEAFLKVNDPDALYALYGFGRCGGFADPEGERGRAVATGHGRVQAGSGA